MCPPPPRLADGSARSPQLTRGSGFEPQSAITGETEARMRTMIEAAIAEIVAQLGRKGIQANFEPQEKLLRFRATVLQ